MLEDRKLIRDFFINSIEISFDLIEFRWHVDTSSGFDKNRVKSHFHSDETSLQHSIDHERFESNSSSQPIYQAHALHNFHAQTNRELPFTKGDIIDVRRRINDDWLEGEHQGRTGIFPVSYVDLIPYESNEGEGIVKYDFVPQQSSELQLRKGDRVILLHKIDQNWYEGRMNHSQGIFPADYIDVLREPKANKTLKSVLKTSSGFQQTAIDKMNLLSRSSLPMQKCQVLYDYSPQNPDELEIHVGDVLSIIEMCDDGWYCGVMENSNHENKLVFGTFPGNYVKILPI